MFATAKIARRRMKLEELIAKALQIEEQAALTLAEYPRGLTVERQRLIIGIAKQIRAHLEDQMRAGDRRLPDARAEDTEAHHLYSVRQDQNTA
jgi:hypothetical protein